MVGSRMLQACRLEYGEQGKGPRVRLGQATRAEGILAWLLLAG